MSLTAIYCTAMQKLRLQYLYGWSLTHCCYHDNVFNNTRALFRSKVGPINSNATQHYVTRAYAYIVVFVEKYFGICYAFLLLPSVYSYCT